VTADTSRALEAALEARVKIGQGGQPIDYFLHSDGVVCRCAIRWRRETLARGLNRPPEEWDEPADEAAGGSTG
jgi:hypothetical protein